VQSGFFDKRDKDEPNVIKYFNKTNLSERDKSKKKPFFEKQRNSNRGSLTTKKKISKKCYILEGL